MSLNKNVLMKPINKIGKKKVVIHFHSKVVKNQMARDASSLIQKVMAWLVTKCCLPFLLMNCKGS